MEREHKEIMDMELKKNDPEAYKEMKKKEEEEKKKRKKDLKDKRNLEDISSDESDNEKNDKKNKENDIKLITGTAALIQLNDSKRAIEQDKKRKNYEMKQIKIQKKIERLENQHQLKLEMEERKKNQKLERIRQNQQTNVIQNYEKSLRIKKIIQAKALATFQVKNDIKDECDNRAEYRTEFLIKKHDKIQKLRMQEQLERDKLKEELIEKQIKYEKARQDARDIVTRKNDKLNEIEKQRMDDIVKAQTILSSGINRKNCKKLIKNFNDNKYLKEVIDNYLQEKYKSEDEENQNDDNKKKEKEKKQKDKKEDKKNQSHYPNNKNIKKESINANKSENENKSKNENDDNKSEYNNENKSISSKKSQKEDGNSMKLSEKEIKEKVNKYKKELLKAFSNLIKEEKNKEEERKKYLESLTNETDKKVAETQFGKIRTITNKRLEDEKQRITDKIRFYEYNLRKNNEEMEKEYQNKKKNN